MDNYNKNYDNNSENSYSKDNSANLGKVFLILFCVTFCLIILFGIGAGIAIRIEEEREEKLRQERYVQERKRLDDAYESQRKYEEERERREEEKKRREEEKKKREEEWRKKAEEWRKKAEENRKKRDEEWKKREEEAEKLYEIVNKEFEEFSKNGTKNRDQYNLMSEEELIEELNKFYPIFEKFEKLESLRVSAKAHKLVMHFHMTSSDLIHVAIEKDYPILLEKLVEKKVFVPNNWRFNHLPVDFYIADKDKRKCLDYVLKDGYDLKKELGGETKEGNVAFKEEVEEGLTLLHIAAKRGNLSLAKRVLDAGVSVNKRTKEGITPLDYAIKNNQEEMIKFLKERGGVSNPRIEEKNTSLNEPQHSSDDNKEMTKDTDRQEKQYEDLNTETSTEIAINTEVSSNETKKPNVCLEKYMVFSEESCIEEAEHDFQNDNNYILCLGPAVVPFQPMMVRPMLAQIAIEKDYSLFLDKLCKNDFHPINEPEKFIPVNSKIILSMIVYAAEKDSKKCVDVLIKNGADLRTEAPKPKNKDKIIIEEGKTVLHCAAEHGDLHLMKRIIGEGGFPLDKKTASGKTPLYFAVKNNYYEAAYMLINKGAVREESLKSEAKDERMLKLLETGKYSSK